MTLRRPLSWALCWRAAAVAAALLPAACAPTLAGQLLGADGAGISSAEARVNIVSLAPGEPVSVVVPVDGGGRFKTDAKLAPGPYMVEALVPGYSLSSQRVTLGDATPLELHLSPLPTPRPAAVGVNMDAEPGRGAGSATLTPPSM